MNIKRKYLAKRRYLAYSLYLLLASNSSFSSPVTQEKNVHSSVNLIAHKKNAHSCMAAPPNTERCYGISQKGKNHCASPINNHSCHSMASKDYDPNEWEYVPKGKCSELKKNLAQRFHNEIAC